MPKLNTMDAIEALARFIEREAAKDLAATLAVSSELDAMASEYCTTRDVYVRALQISVTISALIDNLDWPSDTKMACREFLAALGQKDMAWMAELRRRRKLLS